MEIIFKLEINDKNMTSDDISLLMSEIVDDFLEPRNTYKRGEKIVDISTYINTFRPVKTKYCDKTFEFKFSPTINSYSFDFMQIMSVLISKLETYTEFRFVS